MLFQRYSDPLTLLNLMIRAGRLREFVSEIVNIKNEETEDQALWEFWLHKDFERSFTEFRETLVQSPVQEASEEELVFIIQQSQEILSFVPPGEQQILDPWALENSG